MKLLLAGALIAAMLPDPMVKAAPVLDAPLPVTIAVGAKQFVQFETLEISPDGRFAAYILQDGKRITESFSGTKNLYTKSGALAFFQGCDIWLTDLRTGRTLNLAPGFGESWSPVWSRSGRYLAFLSDHGGAVHVWTWDRLSGKRHRVSSAVVHDTSLTGMLHWINGDRDLLTTLLPSGTTVADADAYRYGYLTKRNGRMVLSHTTVRVYRNDPQSPDNAERLPRLQSYDGSSNGDPFAYALIDVALGDATRVFPNVTADEMAISDDQRYVVIKRGVGEAIDGWNQELYDLIVASLANGKILFTLHDIPMAAGWTPTWQPGKDAFVYTTGARHANMATKQHGAIGQGFFVSVPDGRTREITSGLHPEFGMYDQSAGWSADGERLYYMAENRIWIADVTTGIVTPFAAKLRLSMRAFITTHDDRLFQRGNTIFVLTRNPVTKQEGIAALTSAGTISAQLLGNEHIGGLSDTLVAASTATNSIVYVAESATHPWDIWKTGPAFTHIRQLTHFNPDLEHYTYGQSRLVTWSTPDGTSYKGALLLPSDYIPGHRYPTILYQYPGDAKSDNLNNFGGEGAIWGNFQLYATRGFAVFMPDMVWKSFNDADVMNGRALTWLNAMLDRLVALGISDPHRFGIEGGSNGGYSTLAFLTQTHRFSAAIDDSGIASRLTLYTEFSPNGDAFYVSEVEQARGGTPWTSLRSYIANSPFYKFDRITTPLMIFQGSGAMWVQQKEGDETYVALRRLNKEVTYVVYVGDGHTRWSWTYPHEIDYWNRAIDWYDRWLMH